MWISCVWDSDPRWADSSRRYPGSLSNRTAPLRWKAPQLPGMPPQVMCYERAEGLGFGVSGVVTQGKGIRASFPQLDLKEIPMSAPVVCEKVVYLMDPVGASRRSILMRLADRMIRAGRFMLPVTEQALELPWTPGFLHKQGGFVCSLGQFNQWVANQLMSTGTVQIWPGTPAAKAVIEEQRVVGVAIVGSRHRPPRPAVRRIHARHGSAGGVDGDWRRSGGAHRASIGREFWPARRAHAA